MLKQSRDHEEYSTVLRAMGNTGLSAFVDPIQKCIVPENDKPEPFCERNSVRVVAIWALKKITRSVPILV